MIFSYNKKAVGDTLLVTVANANGQAVEMERRGTITRVFLKDSNETVAWNIFDASILLPDITGNGQIFLTSQQLASLNDELTTQGFTEAITDDGRPKIVVGFVKECVPHPDSDHLSVTQTEVDNGEVLQIVCGASNIREGLKVVVAKPGAMMPDGLMIWPGALRGVESLGMICSASELAVPNAPKAKGILELPESITVGTAFIAKDYIL
ncbi:YtpR family tRNA-binding protein [Vagococcus intermedius]|uniref:DUF4479 and tRNA-binding domain-containing protein n=1 Tax=Vagococcus intermedius TaxID=2991418 RepID=A0AAF0CVG9_9ENTE|nr:DUF4479 and tRNA-binding domain-containing protein [Vagococcus intermedius]WEG73719.1 DUF4479 and tRNA-binding domain-containing protein [Vagococcus intermedius]WEG75804.1 DUF4479 and tRNA-binding domain-containing protein [Vagococcus intermedius]